MTALTIPQPTSLAQVEDTCATVEEWAEQCHDIPALRDTANKLAAIDEYLSRTSNDGRARVAAAVRRLEQRIGALDVTRQGQRTELLDRDQEVVDPLGNVDAATRSHFRQMAAHPDIVDDVINQSDDKSPASRRKVMQEIKERTQRRPFDDWSADELDIKRRLDDGDTVVVSLRSHPNLVQWATDAGRFERIDRRTPWGNPFEMPGDGDRATVIRNYAEHYLPHKPSLIDRLGDLQGKALGCWCAPEPCHGDVLKREVDG